ncbi:MAG: FtsW/RodA/SpoVE family cell cycle protein [Candidatus Hydrothermales bacterium]
MGERNLIFFVLTLSLLSFIFLFSSSFYSWIFVGEEIFFEDLMKIISRNILNVIFFLIGLIFPIAIFKKFRFFIAWTLLILLSVPIILDISIKNTHRWLTIGDFTLQPSEIFKIGFLLQMSHFLSEPYNLLKFIGTIFYILLSIFLLYNIPHFSMIISIIFVTFSLLFINGVKLNHLLLPLSISLLIIIALLSLKRGYVISRIEKHMSGETVYQVKQAKIAISRGGILGVGIGKGKIKYKFLPEVSKDFLFSHIAEETGLLGVFILILIYSLIIKTLFDSAILISDEFYRNFLFGTGLFIFFNVFVHISVNLGLLPVTGVPLPLLSYGGSSGITYSFLLGVSLNIIKSEVGHSKEENFVLWSRFS